ncbi:MAG: hypothetical protein H7289_10095 [Mucilaginibacter sp.]|nr:hypothetical protein [Mucilaginibacter sp.]
MVKTNNGWIVVLGISLLISTYSCNGAKNNKEAYIVIKGNKSFIKLKGKRNYMVHDPISLVFNKTYEDSTLISLPRVQNGIIKGNEIITEKGYYKYTEDSFISIDHQKLKIYLQYNDTDDKKVEQDGWNGEYNLVNHK